MRERGRGTKEGSNEVRNRERQIDKGKEIT